MYGLMTVSKLKWLRSRLNQFKGRSGHSIFVLNQVNCSSQNHLGGDLLASIKAGVILNGSRKIFEVTEI